LGGKENVGTDLSQQQKGGGGEGGEVLLHKQAGEELRKKERRRKKGKIGHRVISQGEGGKRVIPSDST